MTQRRSGEPAPLIRPGVASLIVALIALIALVYGALAITARMVSA